MKKIYKNIIIIVTLLIILFKCLITIDNIVTNIIHYTILFFKRIFPVSFLFITISNLLIEYNFIQIIQKVFKIKSPYICIFILSLISGFPSGAIYTKEMLNNRLISVNDANKIIMFCHFPNPLFVINSIGIILNSKFSAIIILLSIIISNFLILLIINKNNKTSLLKFNNCDDFSKILSDKLLISFKSILIIYGISIFFYLISIIINYYVNNTFLYVFISGIFDLTNGVYSTTLLSNNYLSSILIIFFISFGSLSIHFQTKSILSNTNVLYNKYLLGRIIGFLFSIIIYFLFIMVKDLF